MLLRRREAPHEEASDVRRSVVYSIPQHLRGEEPLIGIEAQNPLPPSMGQRYIAGGGKVIVPLMFKNSAAELSSNVRGSVLRAGVDNNDFVGYLANGGKASRECVGFIPCDKADTEAHGRARVNAPCGDVSALSPQNGVAHRRYPRGA